MRTVVATSYTPTLDSGRAVRTYGIVRALAKHGPVDLVYGAFGSPRPDPAYESIAGVTLHRVERPGRLARIPSYLRARLGGVPDDFARGIWPGVRSETVRLLDQGGPARVIAEGPVVAAALLPLAARSEAIYSAHNLESAFRHRLTESGTSLRALQRFERRLLRSYAECWMVSTADIEGASALVPTARLRLVQNVVDVAAIAQVGPREGQRVVLFVADLGYEPNRDALRFLIEKAMPSVWQDAPDVRLRVAGKGSERIEPPDARIEALGFVPDLRSLYAAAGCVAVPLLEGGGSPLKFVEALAYGVPVVATPLAASGLDAEPDVEYAEAAGEPAPFARALLDTLDPERGNRLARAGRALAEREYSIEALERRLS